MSTKAKISIMGCGWLGLPLARRLISRGFDVKGSTTQITKLETLRDKGIDPYLVHFAEPLRILGSAQFFDSEILIITIPPGRRDADGFENYRTMISYLADQSKSGRKYSRVILISSTSVYGDNNAYVDELTPVAPSTPSGELMVESELRLSADYPGLVTLRLAGLFGPGRQPGRFFAGKENIPNGLAPVNLLHLDDANAIILAILENTRVSGIFNCCAPSHPTRNEFYTLAAQHEGIALPQFIPEKRQWKVISSCRVEQELGYQFKVPNLINWVKQF